MALNYINKFEREGVPQKEDKPLIRFITCGRDLLNDSYYEMVNDSKLKDYAIKHPEKNMVQLFDQFNYPVPKTKEELDDPKFNASYLFKKDDKGNLIPRPNIYCNKSQNSMDSSYSLLKDLKVYARPKTKAYLNEYKIKKNIKRKKLEKSKSHSKIKNGKVRKSYNSKDNLVDKETAYKRCMKHYCEKLNNLRIQEIKLANIKSLGQLYYIIKMANNPGEQYSYLKNSDNYIYSEDRTQEEKKAVSKINYINYLLKNCQEAKDRYGPFSWIKGDSQLIGEAIGRLKLETQTKLDIRSSNVLFDEHTVFLILKAKRIHYIDVLKGHPYYFNFYVGNQLIPTPVKVKYYTMGSRQKVENFDDLMGKIKINDELIIAFALNPTLKFYERFIQYEIIDKKEGVHYLDSSKTNVLVEEIFNEINKNN